MRLIPSKAWQQSSPNLDTKLKATSGGVWPPMERARSGSSLSLSEAKYFFRGLTGVDSCRFRGELWQITHSHVGQSQQRREGAQHQTVGGHQPKQAFVVDIGRGLLIEPDHVLAGALKLAASLVVGLEADIRGAAGL